MTATANGRAEEKASSVKPEAETPKSSEVEHDTPADVEVIEETEENIKVPSPDDPGVESGDEKPTEKRFRLF